MKVDISYNSNFFWRIIFTILIALLHSNFIVKDMANMGWYIAVDYFFIISGFWLINSFERKGEDTTKYILRRVLKLYPHHLLSFIIIFIWNFWMQDMTGIFSKFLKHMGEALPFTYFVFDNEYAGNFPFNFPVWYLSVLLLSSLIIYCFIHNYKKAFCTVIAPCFIIFVYGYFYRNCLCLNSGSTIGLFLNEYYIRGFADMCLGVIIYCFVKRLANYVPTKLFFFVAHIMEFLCLGGVIIFTYNHSGKNDIWMVMIMAIGIICSFVYSKKTIFNAKCMKKLNDLMYPVYLNHILVISVLEYFGIRGASVRNALIYMTVLLVYSCITNGIVKISMCMLKKSQTLFFVR